MQGERLEDGGVTRLNAACHGTLRRAAGAKKKKRRREKKERSSRSGIHTTHPHRDRKKKEGAGVGRSDNSFFFDLIRRAAAASAQRAGWRGGAESRGGGVGRVAARDATASEKRGKRKAAMETRRTGVHPHTPARNAVAAADQTIKEGERDGTQLWWKGVSSVKKKGGEGRGMTHHAASEALRIHEHTHTHTYTKTLALTHGFARQAQCLVCN